MSIDKLKDALPKVQINKNGYEIRTDVLGLAKQFTEFEFSCKWNGWEQTTKRDEKTGQLVNKTTMPDVPGREEVLETAEMFYNFVTGKTSSTK
jgi:hypothetical protein